MDFTPLPRRFYERPTLRVARELLGKILVRNWKGRLLSGKIVECEAYIGEDDPACHAAVGKTERNAVMYGPPGFAYIYFIYGMYYCLNVVTERAGFPAAVLIRALEPLEGIEWMMKNRNKNRLSEIASGPGKLCQALALDRNLNGADFCGDELFIVQGDAVPEAQIVADSRVGISSGQHHPWRFFLKNNPHVSGNRKKTSPGQNNN